jgi:AraC family transcriptional regulator
VKTGTAESYQERLVRVLQHIERNLDDDLPLEELARVACFSPYHFHRIFRAMVGESVAQHVRRLRLERAAMRLRQGDRAVVDIALDSGYDTHETFTRAFSSRFGVSPSGFRKNNAQRPADGSCWRSEVDAEIRKMERMHVAYVRHVGPYDEVGQTWGKLMGWAGRKGLLGPGAICLGISHDDPEITEPGKLRYDAAITVPESTAGEGDIGTQDVEGGEYVVATHKGPYSGLGAVYSQLCGEWLPASGRELRNAPPIEIYRKMGMNTPAEEQITEVCLPLA